MKQNKLINWALDTFAFTPEWTRNTLDTLGQAKEAGDVLVLHSQEDAVSDCRGLEKYITHVFPTGKHARLFHPNNDNSFEVVSNFVQNFDRK